MKATGIVRRIDDLGRVVLPKEIRDVHGWVPGTSVEFYVNENGLVITDYKEQCAACRGSMKKLMKMGAIKVCRDCLQSV